MRQYNVTILTSPSRSDERSEPGKREWVNLELGEIPIIFARGGTKALHLKHGDILIDDLPKNILNLTEGKGILHTSASDTIVSLKELLNGPYGRNKISIQTGHK